MIYIFPQFEFSQIFFFFDNFLNLYNFSILPNFLILYNNWPILNFRPKTILILIFNFSGRWKTSKKIDQKQVLWCLDPPDSHHHPDFVLKLYHILILFRIIFKSKFTPVKYVNKKKR